MQIEEGQTIQWSKEKGQKDKQRTRDRATRTLLKTGVTLSDQCNIRQPHLLISYDLTYHEYCDIL
jgi:hypothetical protein